MKTNILLVLFLSVIAFGVYVPPFVPLPAIEPNEVSFDPNVANSPVIKEQVIWQGTTYRIAFYIAEPNGLDITADSNDMLFDKIIITQDENGYKVYEVQFVYDAASSGIKYLEAKVTNEIGESERRTAVVEVRKPSKPIFVGCRILE